MNVKTDKADRQKWIDALESGKYQKGKHRLKYENSYCCLGVLAEMNGDLNDDGYYKGRHSGILEYSTDVPYGLIRTTQLYLADINDYTDTFEPVIKAIKALPYGE